MKVGEAIDKAVRDHDAAAAGGVADFLRFKGMNYEQILAMVQRRNPKVDRAEWDALLYEADTCL
jgi:hypothetical protein